MIPSDGSPAPDGRDCVCGHRRGRHRSHDYLDAWYECHSEGCECEEFAPIPTSPPSYPDAPQKADPPLAAAPSLEVERAVKLLTDYAWAERSTSGIFADPEAKAVCLGNAEFLIALAARFPALEAENRQLATDLAAAHAAVDRGVAQLLTLHEDAALLRAERDDALAKLAGFTAEDVGVLRLFSSEIEVHDEGPEFPKSSHELIDFMTFDLGTRARLQSLASRLAALLPPPPSSKRDE